MSNIHYFQRYSQRENVVTNNTLLLLSRLYNHSPVRFQAFLSDLLDDEGAEVIIGPEFAQQSGNVAGSSIPDGAITQQSFKMLIETKLYDNYGEDQLLRHIAGFGDEQLQVLLLVNPDMPNESFISGIRKDIRKKEKNVHFVATTFEAMIRSVDNILFDYDVEMNELLQDYREYCEESGVLPKHKYYMRAITAGVSFDENMEFGVYYDQKERGYSSHAYIGLYKDKAVRAIGKISKVFCADYDQASEQFLSIQNEQGELPTSDEKERVVRIMNCALKDHGWDIYQGHRFFLVDEFFETNYRKSTKYPIQRTRFFDLQNILGLQELPSVADLADHLKKHEWE